MITGLWDPPVKEHVRKKPLVIGASLSTLRGGYVNLERTLRRSNKVAPSSGSAWQNLTGAGVSKGNHSSCRCFGSDRTPGVAPQDVFRSRTVSTTVAKWFVPIARGTMDKICRFGPLRDA
jgi:hypothetical protein